MTAPGGGLCPGKGLHVYRRHVDASVKQLHDQIDDATASLLETVTRLTDEDWPTTFNQLELPEPMRGQRADRIV